MERDGFEHGDLGTLSARRARAMAVPVLILLPPGVAAQGGGTAGGGRPGFLSTVAGTAEVVPGDGGPAAAAQPAIPREVAVDGHVGVAVRLPPGGVDSARCGRRWKSPWLRPPHGDRSGDSGNR